MLKYIDEHIISVVESKVLRIDENQTTYLINNKLVVKHAKNSSSIFKWYVHNQKFAPNPVFEYGKYICYDYLIPTSELPKRVHIINLLRNYQPRFVSEASNYYFEMIENKYQSQCQQLKISPKQFPRPTNEKLYELHGKMNFRNSLIFDEQLILLDPCPIRAPKVIDIIKFYLSDDFLIQMFTPHQIATYMNIDELYFKYYLSKLCVEKLSEEGITNSNILNIYTNL